MLRAEIRVSFAVKISSKQAFSILQSVCLTSVNSWDSLSWTSPGLLESLNQSSSQKNSTDCNCSVTICIGPCRHPVYVLCQGLEGNKDHACCSVPHPFLGSVCMFQNSSPRQSYMQPALTFFSRPVTLVLNFKALIPISSYSRKI